MDNSAFVSYLSNLYEQYFPLSAQLYSVAAEFMSCLTLVPFLNAQ